MAKSQPRAGFWPQLDKLWSGPRVLGQHSLEGRVLGQHSLEGCCGHSLERRTGHNLERRTGHSLEGRCAVALGLCHGPDPWTVARSRRDNDNTVGPAPFPLSTFRISSLSLADEEALKRNEHLVVLYTLNNQNNIIRSTAHLDLSATEFSFIDKEFVRRYSLSLYKLNEPRGLEVIDGRPSQA